MSKEHLFPDWLEQLFPRSPSDTHTHGNTTWVDMTPGGKTPITQERKRQGQAATLKVRVVCETCNNGWLSRLEERTKPLLTHLIKGHAISLGVQEQLQLATWAVKTIMTAEFYDRKKVAIPQDERTSLMQNLFPPSNGWWIWISGNQGVDWQTGLYHFAARLNYFAGPISNVPPIDPKTAEIINLQSTTIGIGRLMIFSVSTTVRNGAFSLTNPEAADLKPIWPQSLSSIPWPPSRLFTDAEIDFIARNVPRSYGVPL
jgi:hypothetical protein